MDFSTICNLILTTAIGIITFFLKRSFDKLDNCASEKELCELKEKIEKADEKYASKAELDELKAKIDKINDKIDDIKSHTLRTDEFLRFSTKIETKIDDLIRRG